MTDRTIVVTGATGKTGKLLIHALAARPGFKVRAAVRSVERARAMFPDIEVVEMDYSRPETVAAAFAGAHRLYLSCRSPARCPIRSGSRAGLHLAGARSVQ